MGSETSGGVLPTAFYDRDTVAVARDLLGKVLRVQDGARWRAGRIVEVEAYVANDPANHAYRGQTRRNRSMFQGPGTLYVYAIHGVDCVNLVTRHGEAVLIRALEPMEGVEGATDGPGKLCRTLGVTRGVHDGLAATGPKVEVVDSDAPSFGIGVSERIGVSRARALPLRFYIVGNPLVSR